MADLGRVNQELKPDPLRQEARRRYFEGHADALAKLLVPMMRDGLHREAADTMAGLDSLQIRGRPVSRWLERLSSRHGSDIELLLQPGDAEISNNAHELAQLLLSNWLGSLTHSSRTVVSQLIDALRHEQPVLPMEVTTGCLAYPVTEDDARTALTAYLRSHWAPDILNQWQADWGREE